MSDDQRNLSARGFEDGTTLHEAATAIAETLASALHHENIGREIRGWREVREAFGLAKQLAKETRPNV